LRIDDFFRTCFGFGFDRITVFVLDIELRPVRDTLGLESFESGKTFAELGLAMRVTSMLALKFDLGLITKESPPVENRGYLESGDSIDLNEESSLVRSFRSLDLDSKS
jgi:hypothetical protein